MSSFPPDGLEGITLTAGDIDNALAWVDDQRHNLTIDLSKRGVTLDDQRRILNEISGLMVFDRRGDDAKAAIGTYGGDMAALAALADGGDSDATTAYAVLRPFVRAIGSALGTRRGYVTITEGA